MITRTSDTTMIERGLSLAEVPIPPDALPGNGPATLRKVRYEALERFNALGLPTLRHEEWRYTSLKSMRELRFVRASDVEHAPDADDLERHLRGLAPRHQIVFSNDRFIPELSTIDSLPDGVTVLPLSEAFQTHAALIEMHLAKYAPFDDEAFAALNTAFINEGVLVRIAEGVTLDDPIRIVNLIESGENTLLSSPRNLIIAERGSSATVVEDYISEDSGGGAHLTNALTEIRVGPEADVRHYLIERENERAFNISTLVAWQDRDSRFISHSVLFGGAIVRNNINPILAGENIHSTLNGLYVGRGSQHLDNHMRVEHRIGQCESRQYYRGIMADDSHGVFTGRIIVSQDAQKTDAVQSNQNLLLSDRALANTRPQLEIYADDVKCTHGATVGELDENALFYLRTRGLDEPTARAMLVHAFANESLERMTCEPIRGMVERLLLEKLPDSAALRPVLD